MQLVSFTGVLKISDFKNVLNMYYTVFAIITEDGKVTPSNMSDVSVESHTSLNKPLLSTSTDMSLQELVEKYTPGRLKVRI